MWFRPKAFLIAVVLASACGGTDEDLGSTHAGGAAGSGAGDSGSALAGSAGSGGLIVIGDAAPPSFDGPDLADAGWFDCEGCACNGATSYCLVVDGGPVAPGAPPPPDAALCDTTSGFGCTLLPSECVDAPSCSCIPPKYGGACECSDAGGGLRVYCWLP